MEKLLRGDKELLKKAFSVLSASMVLAYTVTPPIICTDISESQNSKSMLQMKKKELNQKLQEASNEVRKEAKNKNALNNQIKIAESQIDVSNDYISKLDEEISDAEHEIERIQEDIKKKIKALKKSLYSIYVAGDTSTLDIILGAKDFEDFLDKVDIVRSVGQTIKELIDGLNRDLESVENKKKEILETRSEKEKEKESLEKSRSDLQVLYDKSEKLLSELQETEQDAKRRIDQNDAEIKAIDAQIERYYAEQRRLEEEAKRRREAGQNPIVPARNLVKHVGGYTWPVPGYHRITSGFTDSQGRAHVHGAIDIAGAGIYGAPIVASGSGRVIVANAGGWGGGYGHYVIIDHGNGKSTLYGHMSNVCVKTGQSVSAGQQIGNVGNTGFSTGPHLHFEYRVNGIRTNPSCIVSY